MCSLTFLFSITIADWLMYWTNNQQAYPHFFLLTFFFNFLYGPLFYFYIKELAGDQLTKFQRYLHLVPFLSVIIVCIPALSGSTEEKREMILRGFQHKFSFYSYFIPFANWFSIFLMLFYGFLSVRMSARFSLYKTVHKWANLTIAAYCIFSLNFIVYEILSKMPFFNPLWDYGIALSMILMIFILAVCAYIQPQVFNGYTIPQSFLDAERETIVPERHEVFQKINMSESFAEEEISISGISHHSLQNGDEFIYSNSNNHDEHLILNGERNGNGKALKPSTAVSAQLMERLNDLMINEKLYTQYDLRLDTIAGRLYVSRKKISQLINEKFEMNFFEYINTMRIEEAKRMLETEHDLSIKEIMYNVGFNNKVSFYKAFKNKTGLTPTDFKQKMQAGTSNDHT